MSEQAQGTGPTDGGVVPVPATRHPRFDRFRYEGRDPIYDSLEAGAGEYVNPILPGFHPDPSVCRSGDDYYLVVSSFAWFPGVPVFHSRNLVDWKLVGHALHRPEQLDLDGHGISRGIFAPTIRCHGGRLWVITTLIDTGGTLLVTADEPAGPWSDPVRLPEVDGIDPSIFFDDDGRVWITNNGPPPGEPLYDGHRALWIQEYDPAAERTIGPRTLIVNGGVDLSAEPVWIEAPHIFRVDGWYYLIAAEGGTSENHSEVVFRSRSVAGPYEPYEGNPILTQRHLPPDRPHPVTSAGHADFVRTPAGDWWAVFLATRPYRDGLYNTGRETFLLPVDWSGEWPVILDREATVPYVHERPDLPPGAPAEGTPHPAGNFTLVDEFDGPDLPLYWNRIRTPRERWHDLTSDPGWLRIHARSVPLGGGGQPSFLGRRQQHAHARASTVMRYAPERVGDRAGLAAFYDDDHFYLLAVARTAEGVEIRVEGRTGGDTTVLARRPLPEPGEHRVRLRIDARGAAYDFHYALDDGPWVPVARDVDGTILSTRVAGGFVGTFFGLHAYGAPGAAGAGQQGGASPAAARP